MLQYNHRTDVHDIGGIKMGYDNMTDAELTEVILDLLDALGLVTEEAGGHTQGA